MRSTVRLNGPYAKALRDHMKTVQDIEDIAAVLGNQLQIGLPHVRHEQGIYQVTEIGAGDLHDEIPF